MPPSRAVRSSLSDRERVSRQRARRRRPTGRRPPVRRPIDVVRVVEQPLDVTLSLPGELTPYQTVAIYPRVTGFVKTIRVDRGSRVRPAS